MLNGNKSRNVRQKQVVPAIAFGIVASLIALTLVEMLGYVGIVAAATNTVNTISVSLTVQGVCVPTLSSTLITFPPTKAGYFAPTANAVTIGDSGTVGSNIVLYSISDSGTGNWVSGSNSFGVSNTLWNPTSDTGSNLPANALTNSIATDTQLYVSPSPVVSNTIYFGVNVPAYQATGTYSQGITVSLSC